MSDFVVFSDFHAHNFSFAATEDAKYDGLNEQGTFNSRLIDCVNVLREISAYEKANNIKLTLFGGDLFHSRQAVKTAVSNVIFTELSRLYNSPDKKLLLIPGNHDFADRHGHIHSLQLLSSFAGKSLKMYDAPCSHIFDDELLVVTVPYTDDKNLAQQRLLEAAQVSNSFSNRYAKVLLAHLGIQGATVGADYVLTSPHDISLTDVPEHAFDLCLFGHYHQHQQLSEKTWFIGATHQHNWGDANTQRGFLHVSFSATNKYSIKFVETTTAPRFVKGAGELSHRPQDFVMHTMPNNVTRADLVALRKQYEGKCAYFDVTLTPTEDTALPTAGIPEGTFKQDKLVEEWVKLHGEGDASLVSLGKELLSKVSRSNL